ncbi:MAG TPA: ABC transporter permease [Candidatus Polarisedimenticolia bacterium]|nr:ABC transporter permease [Candidatus Polarisedimenticolia bacterium]
MGRDERRDDRRDREREMEAELQFHLEAAVAEHVRAGLSPEEARRRALHDLGAIEVVKDDCRGEWRGALLASFLQDVHFGARLLRRSPGFTAAALLTLALGIGASTLLFGIADTALLKPLPFPEPDRLVRLWDTNRAQSIPSTGVTTGNVVDWRLKNRTLSGVVAWYVMGRTLRTDDEAVVVESAQVSADFFQVFGIPPAIGRAFTSEETDRATINNALGPTGADPVAIISHHLWKSRYHGDPDILDRTVFLESQPWRIVGVMPDGFATPAANVEVWIPWSLTGTQPRDQHFVQSAARLRPGVTLEQAQADLDALAVGLEREFPSTNLGWRVFLVPLQEDVVGGARRMIVTLLAGVALVLLVACANLAGLQLVRATRRRRETAMRLALGASRARLVRQHLTESGMLAVAGGALGLLAAAVLLGVLKRWAVTGIPRLAEASLDLRVGGFALTVTLLAGLLFGLAPALASLKAGRLPGLNEAARGTEGPVPRRWRAWFVAGQVCVAFVLLAGAGLLVRSYGRLLAVDPGFVPDRVLVAPVFLDTRAYDSRAKSHAYYSALESRLAAIPGVESVGAATALPASPLGPDFERPVWAGDRSSPLPEEVQQADVRIATPGYFDTLGMRLVRGRGFRPEDGPDAPLVLIVSESLARRLWPGADPVGRQLTVDYSTAGTYPYQVVGVVGDILFRGLRSDPRPEIYLPHAQRPYLVMNVAVRAAGDPVLLIPSVRQALREIDPMRPAHSITPLRDLVAATVARDRFAMQVVLAFALTSLGLAILGLYGVLSYSVRQRVPEIGVRMALGADRRDVLALVLGDGARIVFLGLVTGLATALLMTRGLRSLLFGIGPHDPPTYAAVALLLALTAMLAAWIPARRAAATDPLVALRHE